VVIGGPMVCPRRTLQACASPFPPATSFLPLRENASARTAPPENFPLRGSLFHRLRRAPGSNRPPCRFRDQIRFRPRQRRSPPHSGAVRRTPFSPAQPAPDLYGARPACDRQPAAIERKRKPEDVAGLFHATRCARHRLHRAVRLWKSTPLPLPIRSPAHPIGT